MRERIKRLLGRGPEFTIDPATRAPTGRLRLDEAVTLGLAAVGRHSYGTWMSPAIHVVASEGPRPNIQIGGFCSIAPGVQFLAGGRHHSEWITTFPLRIAFGIPGAGEDGHPLPPRPIIVGNDVWLARDVTVIDGVTIGDGAIVAAGAVVTADVRPYAIVGGNPAREIRRRFSDAEIERLLALRWWDWSDEKIRANVDTLCSPNVEALLSPSEDGHRAFPS